MRGVETTEEDIPRKAYAKARKATAFLNQRPGGLNVALISSIVRWWYGVIGYGSGRDTTFAREAWTSARCPQVAN